jgi:hypothetical protein
MSNEENVAWVVYQIGIREKTAGLNAVCEQSEWDAMELARPAYHTLIRGGILSETEAERLARGTSGDSRKVSYSKKQSRLQSLAQPLR